MLRKSNQTKDKFFSILGHDLMGPITSIIGLLNLIQRKKMSEEKKSRYIHTVSNELKEIEKLLENLLLWSRSQRGLIRFEPGQCQMREASQEAISIYQSHINTKQIEVVDLIDKNMTVYADENMLKTIMRNLISNAIKFTPLKGKIEIGAITKTESTYAEIWVKDYGIGMKPEIANQLFTFESRTTTKGTNDEKGSGLGLTLCKEFVDKHKGNIWAKSTLNQGSTFTFTIPHNLLLEPYSCPSPEQKLFEPLWVFWGSSLI
ncbi:sensor histidine kinase [Marinilabilia sp.]